MRNKLIKWFIGLVLVLSFYRCRKPFEPAILDAGNKYLVVTGFINANPASQSKLILSRTLKLYDTITFIPEDGALVNIESSTGFSYSLFGVGNGRYNTGNITLVAENRYRLNITTQDGKQYQSEFISPKRTPPIDSITWEQKQDVKIFVNTRDPANKSRYYWWEFTETSEYRTPRQTPYGVSNGRIYVRKPEEQVSECWTTKESTDLLIGTSELLSEDIISKQPLLNIPFRDKRLHYKYSILVRQYAITAQAFKYWQVIQKNSQQLGTLFDQQPAQLKGNIFSLSNPEEPVIGFFSVAEQQEKRIFIVHLQLNDWVFDPFDGYNCAQDFITPDPVDPYIYTYPYPEFVPWYFITGGPLLVSTKDCVDCTTKGGTNIKPSFW